ncbi:hypothetical protein K883_02667 [Mycobacterium sp. TKK-01-0059]|nr:hypothetical protein K883_02667 [Mycobacterium sp. TKK-01-0059]
MISHWPLIRARLTSTLLDVIAGSGLSLLVVLWSTSTSTTAESGRNSETAAPISRALACSDFCLAAGATIWSVNWL